MRVGVVTTSYPRAPGDPAGSFVAAHVDWLVRAGHAVDVLCAAAGQPHQAWQPGARSLVTPMGVDVARWRAARIAHAAHGAGQRGPGGRTVLFLGRLVPIKGVAVLLDAVAQLPPACAPVRVIVAGDGPLRAELGARARDLARADRYAVELVGEVRGADRDRLLAGADVLVLPSSPVAGGRSEGAPVTALEAMAAGVPVVASRTGGLAELPPGTVTLVPPGHAAALAEGLARCLTDDALRDRQIEAGLRWVTRHDWGAVGARLWGLTGAAR